MPRKKAYSRVLNLWRPWQVRRIKEIAKEKGISDNAVYRKMLSLGLRVYQRSKRKP